MQNRSLLTPILLFLCLIVLAIIDAGVVTAIDRQRFQTESHAIAKLNHPNIVGVFDVSHSESIEYIVMELLDGVTLKQYLREHGPLDVRKALDELRKIGALDE